MFVSPRPIRSYFNRLTIQHAHAHSFHISLALSSERSPPKSQVPPVPSATNGNGGAWGSIAVALACRMSLAWVLDASITGLISPDRIRCLGAQDLFGILGGSTPPSFRMGFEILSNN